MKPSFDFLEHFRKICSVRNPSRAVEALMKSALELMNCEDVMVIMLNEDNGKFLVVTSTKGQSGRPTFDEVDTIDKLYKYSMDVHGPILINSPADAADVGVEIGTDVKTLLVVPAMDTDNRSTCLMSFKNKLGGKSYSRQCLEDAESLAYLAELIMKTYLLYTEEVSHEIKCTALLDIIKAVGTASGDSVNSFLFTVSRRSRELFNAEKCTMYVVDKEREILWSASTDSGKQIMLPMSSGVVGAVATTCKTINITDAYDDPRFNKSNDQETGFKTKCILCAPVTKHKVEGESSTKGCVAVIQLINKTSTKCFSKEEEELLNQLCEILGDRMTDGILLECFKSQFVVVSFQTNFYSFLLSFKVLALTQNLVVLVVQNSNTVVNEATRKLNVRSRRRSISTTINEADPGSLGLISEQSLN